MSFAARRLMKKFRAQGYQQIVSHSFLHPNQRFNLFQSSDRFKAVDQFEGGQLVTISYSSQPNSQILYFHGGAFRVPLNEAQLAMIESIAEATNSTLQIADFPLLPQYSADKLLAFSAEAFNRVIETHLPIFLIADSAGATIANQLLFKESSRIAGTVLVSPWLDLQLTDSQVKTRAANDVMLDLGVLRQIATEFKAGLTTANWVDPCAPPAMLSGQLRLFYGANELLVPSDEQFTAALAKTAMQVEVTPLKDGFHDYILWPDLPETKRTKKQIVTFIKDQRGA
ncbi:hypothetical protein YK48G_22390 [Lentilactobacillus fungorum]|uniref:Alpha/beta hydrolase fold-3 domain-containing protein n=1 Tax=Lentilactobacillus fungorum TaxID=2201250 RepID=A0ABQ3W645_9LACO|nr:alpha/beta hydrolase [Lentilactobacillus fungorum]GHP14814.1 hypothetical protein YK48G_22390 [Lentilactobacillus fungorum]